MEKFVEINGTQVPMERIQFALQFLNDMEVQFGIDFVNAPSPRGA